MSKTSLKKILIAEDEKSYVESLVLKLKHSGYEADGVGNGEEAIEALKKKKYDLIFLDLLMPKMNGFEVLEILKREKITTPVIVISNLAQVTEEKRCRDLGAIDFLNKSNTSLAEVVIKIENILNLQK